MWQQPMKCGVSVKEVLRDTRLTRSFELDQTLSGNEVLLRLDGIVVLDNDGPAALLDEGDGLSLGNRKVRENRHSSYCCR